MRAPGASNNRLPLLALSLGLGLLGREVLARVGGLDLRGGVAVVTGGSRGLGLLLARELGRAGCRLAICARDADELELARAQLEQEGLEVLTAVCDVARREQVEAMVDQVRRRYGRIDVLVNNAGLIQVGPLEAMSHDDFREALDVMFWGPVNCTLAALPHMRARRAGRIVNICSVGGKVAVPHLLPYGAAKFAAVGFSEGLRAELARDGIVVTTVVPGLMRTGSVFNAFFKGRSECEFGLFSVVGNLPFISMDAERAARQIVRAVRRGEAERTLSLPAVLIARLNGLAPGLTADALGLANRLLPRGGGQAGLRITGGEAHARLGMGWLDRLLGWNLSAARRFNQDRSGVARAGASGPTAG